MGQFLFSELQATTSRLQGVWTPFGIALDNERRRFIRLDLARFVALQL
jgi:hypothetical protein